jgi:hypothetical protein
MMNQQTKTAIKFLNQYDTVYQSLYQVPLNDYDEYKDRFQAFCRTVGKIDIMDGKISWSDVKRILDRLGKSRIKESWIVPKTQNN